MSSNSKQPQSRRLVLVGASLITALVGSNLYRSLSKSNNDFDASESKHSSNSSILNIIHFNDVYNVLPSKNNPSIGGVSRFKTFLNTITEQLDTPNNKTLILFSGDFLSPSLMSTVTKGKHMVSVLNALNISVGMIGNHDQDYGNEYGCKMFKKLNFPMLNTNIFDKKTGKPLGNCKLYHIIQNHNYGKYNIGIIGISEDWTNTLPIPCEQGYIYKNFISETQIWVNKLRNEYNINFVIALTHSRLLNDIELAKKSLNLDLILGGHDHTYHTGMFNDTMIVKSGCDFKNATWIQVIPKGLKRMKRSNKEKVVYDKLLSNLVEEKEFESDKAPYVYKTCYYRINDKLSEDKEMSRVVEKVAGKFYAKIRKAIGYIETDLDIRFSTVRSRESNAGNFMCDIIRRAYKCDGVILCGGALRTDAIVKKGAFTFEDVLNFVPFQDPIVCLLLNGSQVIDSLEHAVSGVPKADGKFPQIGGLRFVYDPKKPVGQRVVNVWIAKWTDYDNSTGAPTADEEQFIEIDPNGEYSIATRNYLANGGDGFKSFKNAIKILRSDEEGLPMSTLLRNFFWAVRQVNKQLKKTVNTPVSSLSPPPSSIVDGSGSSITVDDASRSVMSRYNVIPLNRKHSTLILSPRSESVSRSPSVGITDEKKSHDAGDGIITGNGDSINTSDSDSDSDSSDDSKKEKGKKEREHGDINQETGMLTIAPSIEHRIMTVDEKIDFTNEALIPMKQFFKRLPSFVDVKMTSPDPQDKEKSTELTT